MIFLLYKLFNIFIFILKLLLILGISLVSYFFGWKYLRDNVDSLNKKHNKYGQIVSFLILPIISFYLLFYGLTSENI